MSQVVLAINVGSSSVKLGLFALHQGDDALEQVASKTWVVDGRPWIDRALDWADGSVGKEQLCAVGHRIVHGGAELPAAVEIDDGILGRLEALTVLAPLHQPAGLQPVKHIGKLRPDLRQFACFDTAFHRTIGPPASRYALPRQFEAQGIHRYGFHGISYESIADQLRLEGAAQWNGQPSRIIVAHLGGGASLCAMLGLTSVDTTMGFSTLDGLVMGTRAGALDPGILLFLLREKRMSVDELEHLLYRECGLLGVSGISSDVSELLASTSSEAAQALELYAFQAAKQITALGTTLGGIDRIVFTGGVGEHATDIRARIVAKLGWLGADLDHAANTNSQKRISSAASSFQIECRTTNEERIIAAQTLACLKCN